MRSGKASIQDASEVVLLRPEKVLPHTWSGIQSGIPIAKRKAVGAPLSFYREELICQVSKVILAVIPTEVQCHFLGGSVSSMDYFLSAYIMQIMCQLSATRISEPQMGFNPEVHHWIILPSSVPLLGEDSLPFLPLQGVSYSSVTESHPLPNNVSLCFLPGRHWWHNQGKLLHNSRQQAFCFMLMLACEEREFACRTLDKK